MIKKIVIARHGLPDREGSLIPTSKSRIENIIKNCLPQDLGKTVILSSPILRVLQTAQVYQEQIDSITNIEVHPELRQKDKPTAEDFEKIISIIENLSAETVIVCVHGEHSRPLFLELTKKLFGKETDTGAFSFLVPREGFFYFNLENRSGALYFYSDDNTGEINTVLVGKH